jgi:drug/metabolite transporter (DMT)-like permease
MSANLRGILAVLVASTAFVLNDALVKLVSSELPSSEIIILRGTLSTIMLAAGVLALGAVRPISILLAPMMLLRLAAAPPPRSSSSYRCAICPWRRLPSCCR